MLKKCLQGLTLQEESYELDHHPLNRILHWLTRLLFIPALFFTLYYDDLGGYLLLLATFFFFEAFAVKRIVAILTDALNIDSQQSELPIASQNTLTSSILPDEWQENIRRAVAHNQLYCGNCGEKRSGYSIVNYTDNNRCEHCDHP